MSIIEQAARRLEQLRRSGIEIPSAGGGGRRAADSTFLDESVPARAARLLEGQTAALRAVDRGEPASEAPSQPAVHSRRVEIDLQRLASMGYLTPDTPRTQIAEEFRVIKRPLLANVRGGGAAPVERANLIMITSALAGEGKTFVSVNLAISMAMELDKRVLLVDADVARPSVLSRLGLEPSKGLLDVLTDPALELSDVMLRTNIDKLSVLPAGTQRDHTTELLASGDVADLLDDMASRYADRVIIFDAPPLLPTTESRVLASHMGQVVLVVEAEQTPQGSVQEALATIESCPVVMTMLNKVPASEVGSYYGYYGKSEG